MQGWQIEKINGDVTNNIYDTFIIVIQLTLPDGGYC